jgi:hypothetical protein
VFTRLAERKIENGELTLNVLRAIDQTEIDYLYTQFKPVSHHKKMKNVYRMAVSNGNQLYSFLSKIYDNTRVMNHWDADTLCMEGNRLISNYCASIGMLIDMMEKILSKYGEEKIAGLRASCNQLYDSTFEYRFFVILRNFIMHYDLPFTVFIENDTGRKLEFTKEHLLYFTKWKHVKQDIEKMDNTINIMPFIHQMNICLSVVFLEFIFQISKDIAESYERVSHFVIKHKVKAPAIVRYKSVEEYKQGNFSFNPVDFHDLQAAFDEVKLHPKIDLKINNITPDWMK